MSAPPPPDPLPLDDVLIEALVRHELEGQAGIDAVLAAHPQHHAAVHEHLARLREMGLLVPPAAAGQAPTPPSIAGPFPERFGDFQLLRRLGGGGMGVVFLARQLSLGRTVALKLVRADHLLLAGTRERFRREVDAIARLQHPGIVPVFAAGEEHGMPWLAMEHVLGASLAEVLQRVRGRDPATLRGSDLHAAVVAIATERQPDATPPSHTMPALFAGTWVSTCLRIARATALALQHAHERGVLHRDVKPSNVMLTPDGRTLLLDFGLAAAEDQERLTGTGNQLGTPAYMSPEQMRGDSRSLDGRTDVYSLGVTLYELIALQIPFDGTTTMAIRDRVLGGTAVPLRRHNRAAPRDVELVVHRAIDQDRDHRYGDIAAFAIELDNLVELRPISASPPSALRMVRRWAQRHPARATAAVAAVLLFLVAPTVFLLQQQAANREIGAALQRAREQELEARRARDAARVQRDLAREAVDTMLTRVADESLLEVPHMQALRADLLGSARDFYERFLTDGASDPSLLEQTAKAALRVTFVESRLGHLREAIAAATRAAELARTLLAQDPTSFAHHTLLAQSLLSSARGLQQSGDLEPARLALEEAHAHATTALGLQPDPTEATVLLLGIERSLAAVSLHLGRDEEARQHWRALQTLWQRHGDALVATNSGPAAVDHAVSGAIDEVTLALERDQEEHAEAADGQLQALLMRITGLELPRSTRLSLASLAAARAGRAARRGDATGQERELRNALALCDELLAVNPDDSSSLRIRAMAANSLGMILQRRTDRSPEAERLLQQSIDTLRALLRVDPTGLDNRANLAATLVNLGAEARRNGETALARTRFQEAVELAQACHDAVPTRVEWTNYLFQSLWFLGLAHGELDDHAAQLEVAHRLAKLSPPSADSEFVAAELLATAAAALPERRAELEPEVITRLQRAAELGCRELDLLRSGKTFAAVRTRPEFAAILQRIEANAAGK
ncbi:MAG: serine/threonine-protein kinase [Planctomycetes bacterium]|jgi:hypothetical protein|nr:serine/threonine-protein kinase [Planctomycetota bacterium]